MVREAVDFCGFDRLSCLYSIRRYAKKSRGYAEVFLCYAENIQRKPKRVGGYNKCRLRHEDGKR